MRDKKIEHCCYGYDIAVLTSDDSWRMGWPVKPGVINTIARHLESTSSSPLLPAEHALQLFKLYMLHDCHFLRDMGRWLLPYQLVMSAGQWIMSVGQRKLVFWLSIGSGSSMCLVLSLAVCVPNQLYHSALTIVTLQYLSIA